MVFSMLIQLAGVLLACYAAAEFLSWLERRIGGAWLGWAIAAAWVGLVLYAWLR